MLNWKALRNAEFLIINMKLKKKIFAYWTFTSMYKIVSKYQRKIYENNIKLLIFFFNQNEKKCRPFKDMIYEFFN